MSCLTTQLKGETFRRCLLTLTGSKRNLGGILGTSLSGGSHDARRTTAAGEVTGCEILHHQQETSSTLDVMNSTFKFQVFADYHQFYMMDAVAEPLIPEEITEQDMERRLRMAPNIVVFHTESAGRVPVEVAFVECPTEVEGLWEHSAEFTISLPSGTAALCGCTDFVLECPRIEITPSTYRGCAYFAGSASAEERYRLVLWPVAAKALR